MVKGNIEIDDPTNTIGNKFVKDNPSFLIKKHPLIINKTPTKTKINNNKKGIIIIISAPKLDTCSTLSFTTGKIENILPQKNKTIPNSINIPFNNLLGSFLIK
ncbi:hypothetical protein ACSXAF_15050 (plasmid) [Clostridium perfringens]